MTQQTEALADIFATDPDWIAKIDDGRIVLHFTVEQFLAIRAAISSQPPAPSWQPIETAPKDGTVVLLLVPDFGEQKGYEKPPEGSTNVCSGWWGNSDQGYRGKQGCWLCGFEVTEVFHGSEWTGSWDEHEWLQVKPTHWMPLPAARASLTATAGSTP